MVALLPFAVAFRGGCWCLLARFMGPAGLPQQLIRYDPARADEGSSVREADVSVAGSSAGVGRARDLLEPQTQAKAGLGTDGANRGNQIFRSTSESRSGSPTHGVGRSTANEILAKVGVDPDTYVKDLTEEETVNLREAVEALEVEGDLRRDRSQNIKRLSEVGSYRPATAAACRPGANGRRSTPAAARVR